MIINRIGKAIAYHQNEAKIGGSTQTFRDWECKKLDFQK